MMPGGLGLAVTTGGAGDLPEGMLPVVLWIVLLYGLLFLAGIPLLLRALAAEGFRGLFHPARLAWLRSRPWTPLDGASLLLILLSANAILSLAYGVLRRALGWGDGSEQSWLVVQSVAFHWIGFAVMAGWAVHRGYGLVQGFSLRPGRLKASLRSGLGYLAGSMPAVIAAHLVFVAGLLAAGAPLNPQDVTRVIAGTDSWVARAYFALLAVVVAPVVEEMLFRGILLPALSRVLPPVGAMVAVSLLFAVFHANLLSVVALFMLSMGLCMAYARTRNLGAAIVMHSLFNTIPMTALLMGLEV